MGSSHTTRMLVLGGVRIFEPANGYQLRRELLSWEVERWANVNPGSIYSMLGTLTKQGMLHRHDLVQREGTRPIAVYSTTAEGQAELRELVSIGLTGIVAFDQSGFYAALSLMVGVFTRSEVLAKLQERDRALVDASHEVSHKVAVIDADRSTPPHVGRMTELALALMMGEREWLEGFIARVRQGEMAFLGEDASAAWTPADDDPAWRMVREREHYLEQLRRED